VTAEPARRPGPHVAAVNVARPVTRAWGGVVETTAIVKSPVTGPVDVGWDGLAGDGRGSPAHAGPYHAVYVYAVEDYATWSRLLGRDLAPATFGENLTVAGVDVSGALLGDRWRIGSALLEVCGPRIPCQTFARRMGEPQWVKRFTEIGATGCYLRVIEIGTLAAGQAIEIEPVDAPRNPSGMSVLAVFRARTGGAAALASLADVDALAPEVRERAAAARTPGAVTQRHMS
jgi:MOSC domain-containing protein YiiM